MSDYPDCVPRQLHQAREAGQWPRGQHEAAALCYGILAEFPACQEDDLDSLAGDEGLS